MATKPENTKSETTNAQAADEQNKLSAKPAAGADGKTQVETKPASAPIVQGDVDAAQQTNVTGRAVFAVETTGAGVVVRTAFLTEDNKLLNMPAVFPDLVYAINVIDDLKRQVMQHFSQAAQVGAQVIANQARAQQEQQQQQTTTVSGQGEAGAGVSAPATNS